MMFLVLFGIVGVVFIWVVLGIVLWCDCLLEVLLKLVDCWFLFFWGKGFFWRDRFIGLEVVIWIVEIWEVDICGIICFCKNEVVII